MPVIKLPEADWGEAWCLLIQEGGTTRISRDHVYIVSGRQIELLRDKQLSFEVVDGSDRHSVHNLLGVTQFSPDLIGSVLRILIRSEDSKQFVVAQ